MARSYLLSDLVEDVRVRYDLPTFSSTTFVTQTMVERFIQESLQDLYAFLGEFYGTDYFLTTGSLTASSATTALPSDCGKIRKLLWLRGTNDLVDVERGTVDDLDLAFRSADTWNTPRYVLTGRTITWLPAPSTSYTVKIVYSATQPNVDSSSNPWKAENGWAEWVVLDVCRKICQREELDPSVWMAERARVEQRIKSQAPEREDSETSAIRDIWDPLGRLSAWERRDKLTRWER